MTYLWDSSESQKELDKLYEQMWTLVQSYQKYFPYKEDSYVCAADVHGLVKNQEMVMKVLHTAVDAQFPSPKCALRLADIYFEQGDYAESLEMVRKSLKDANRVQQSVNEGYLYYLSGLARISIRNNPELQTDVGSVEGIYRDFEDSLRLGIRRDFHNSIRDKSAVLKRQTGVEIPEDCRKLYELLDGADLL